MKKKINLSFLTSLLLVLLISACEKQGDFIVKPTVAFKNLKFNPGFVLGDTLDLYFDGSKVRSYFGPVGSDYGTQQIAFESDQAKMELKARGTGATVFQKTFYVKDQNNDVRKFYFDGTKVSDRYNYPGPVGSAYTARFYFDLPKNDPNIDVSLEILDYIIDKSSGKSVQVVLGTTIVPIAENIEIGKWSGDVLLKPAPVPVKINPQSRFTNYIVLRKHGSGDLYVGGEGDQAAKLNRSSIKLILPSASATQGKVQSFHVSKDPIANGIIGTDLVPIFPL